MPTTARLGLPYPALSAAADIPADLGALTTALDALVDYRQSTAASRPSNPGHAAVVHWSTDTHRFSYWDGAAWWDIGPTALGDDTITAAMIQANAVTQSKILDGAISTSKIASAAITNALLAAASVDSSKIAASLKPSGGAGGGTEALRALGTAAGNALAGDAAAATPVVCSYSAARSNGQTVTATAPKTGTYIVEWGGGGVAGGSGGNTGNVTTDKTGAAYANCTVTAGNCQTVAVPGVALSAAEVVTATVNTGGQAWSVVHMWLKLTRTA